MSRFRNVLDSSRKDETVTNFMCGESYRINPLDTLKMITASSIFGEPSYYRAGGLDGQSIRDSQGGMSNLEGRRDGGVRAGRGRRTAQAGLNGKVQDARFHSCALLKGYLLFGDSWDGQTTTEIMEQAIDRALEADFEGTLVWAVRLRQDFYMRLNPQVIMVRAAVHPGRKKFTEEHPGMFGRIQRQVMDRGDDAMSQLAYFLYCNHGKQKMPSLLKRSLAGKLESLDAYEAAKYKNAEMGLRDAVRITHAHSAVIDEYMKTGGIELPPQKKTWENLRSQRMDWKDIFRQASMGHMALLRNLRGVFRENEDREFLREYLERLKAGVKQGRQFPFRYYSACQAVEQDEACAHRPQILDALEDCIDLSMEHLPRFAGKTMCLSDNSGSAWGAIPSEYGKVRIAEIDNLSSVLAAAASEEGYVGKFGDRLKVYPVSGRGRILRQAREISEGMCSDVGGSTEGGIWEFFFHAIEKKEHWDQIFIYSDQQAGHGGLYGTDVQLKKYQQMGFSCNGVSPGRGRYINVFDLILAYRREVNPRVNVFSVQTAGYNNVCVPEYCYRTCILYGWTGRELTFARQMIDLWDACELQGAEESGMSGAAGSRGI